MLWTNNNCTEEIEWMPISEPRFKITCQENVRKVQGKGFITINQELLRPTTTITPSVKKRKGNMVVAKKKSEKKLLNGELLTMPMNEQPTFWPLAHLLDSPNF
jgi:hypothetical protein